jgi:hypothetical protein
MLIKKLGPVTMRKNFIFLLILVFLSILNSNPADANLKPVVESFYITPSEIELISENTKVEFKLVVTHPSGIKDVSTQLNILGPNGSTLATNLTRIDAPIDYSLPRVTFIGNLVVPQNINAGVYTILINEVKNNSSAGYEYGTGTINPGKLRDLIGAESGLLVRTGGDLNLIYDTFVGPTHNSSLGIVYNNPAIYNNYNPPIWKVGETYDPNKYYELRVPSLSLIVTSSTPTVCSTDGKELKLLATGNCTFKVTTARTKDYILRESTQNVTITSARSKPELIIGKIANQTSKNLPKSIETIRVYSPSGVFILPKATTPTVCIAAGFYVQIVGGGTCTLTYQSEATTSFLASDLYTVSFEVSRDPQTIIFSPTTNVNLSSRSVVLSASASSGAGILFSTSTPTICSILGSTLNLLRVGNCAVTATQGGTATFAPVSATANIVIAGSPVVSRETITCVKSKSTKRVSGVNPKCPRGFKIKR